MNIALQLLLYMWILGVAVAADPAAVLAPGYGTLEYELPVAGSFELPPIGVAADGEVLDSNGQKRHLHELYGDKITLLSFIYSTCSDVNGCPLTSFVFYKLKTAMNKEPALAENLRLISLSFDPKRDTPEVMRLYSSNFAYAGQAGEWLFLTTESEQKLRPILSAYNQDVQNGQTTGNFSHILRVFLIDRSGRIRNIYSVAFLHTDLILNDVYTLLMEEKRQLASAVKTALSTKLSGAGDYKAGYEQSDYQTRSLSLQARKGKPLDLLALSKSPPLGLPKVPVPADNPLTRDKIALGRKLFYDRRLSLNDTFSCAMCHIPEQGFTSQEMATAVGIEGRTVRRNSPTIYNVAYARRLFHDGREYTLEQQIWGPLLANNEMGNPSIGYVIEKIRYMSDYQGLFEAAFDGRTPSMETLGQAIASYQRTLVSGNSAFDRWYYGKNNSAMSESAKRGLRLFMGKANCVACHHINKEYALFTDNQFHNTGIGYRQSMHDPETHRVLVAPGIYLDIDTTTIDVVSERPPNDLGLYEITQNPHDRWKYKTPSLRNVALTAPYMHNGSLGTLREVVEFYNRGGEPNEVLSPLIQPLGLGEKEVTDLLSFLEALTGDNVNRLVSDAFAAPVGDPNRADDNQLGD